MQALLNAIAQMEKTTDACRVFHGRGGVYPDCEHWTLDWFSPVWVLTSFKVVAVASVVVETNPIGFTDDIGTFAI